MKSKLAAAALATALAASATTAQAVTVVDATRVRVTSAIPTWIQVAELIAIEFGTGTNVALASEGATASGTGSGAGEAIDGDVTGSHPNEFHSSGTNSTNFLEITFGAPATLASLTIHGRDDCCQDRDFYNVAIFNAANETLFSGQLDARQGAPNNNFATVTFDAPVTPSNPVPEPATWTMMLVGFGGLGAVLRRRRRAEPAPA